MSRSKTAVCWVSSARYSKPLNAVDRRKWRLLSELREYEIRVIGFSTSLRPRQFAEGAQFYLLPQPPTSLLRYLSMFKMAPLLLTYLVLRHRCRVLVAQSPFEGAMGAAVKQFARLFGLRPRLIVENHNNFEEDLFLQRKVPFEEVYRRLMLAAARYAFRHADALRVISSSTSERARHYAPTLPQVRFMTFSDTEIFLRTTRRIPVEQASDIIYAGVLIPRKGVHHLLNAFAQLNQNSSQLHLVGKAENSDYAQSLRSQAEDRGIQDRVHFHGAVSQAELAQVLAGARVMVLPSLSEGLGRVVVESMLVGTPVIGSRVGGIPDLISDGDTGWLVEPGDETGLSLALEQSFQADVTTMGERAREFAAEYFSHEKYIDGYRQLFAIARGDDNRASMRKRT